MSTSTRSTVIGVFTDQATADQAINDLKNIGFNSSQIRYFGPGATGGSSGNFFDDLKSLFTGQQAPGGSVTNDLTGMGMSSDEAEYYSNEYKNGHPMVVVNTANHQQEALGILHKYGAYDYSMRSNAAATGTAYTQQPSNYVRSDNYVPPAANPPMNQPGTQPSMNRPDTQPPVNQPGTQPQMRQPVTNATRTDEMQDLQAQLQATQAQIRDAQAQLQAARERETQLRAARERDSQMQTMRKQLQDAQAQLQAMQAELKATQDRIAKANQ